MDEALSCSFVKWWQLPWNNTIQYHPVLRRHDPRGLDNRPEPPLIRQILHSWRNSLFVSRSWIWFFRLFSNVRKWICLSTSNFIKRHELRSIYFRFFPCCDDLYGHNDWTRRHSFSLRHRNVWEKLPSRRHFIVRDPRIWGECFIFCINQWWICYQVNFQIIAYVFKVMLMICWFVCSVPRY